MEHIMIVHFQESMNLNDLEMRKMHSLVPKYLINIGYYYNLNMNVVAAVQNPHIMYLE